MEIEVASEGRDIYSELGPADLCALVLMMGVTIDSATGKHVRLLILFPESTSGFSRLYDLAVPIKRL